MYMYLKSSLVQHVLHVFTYVPLYTVHTLIVLVLIFAFPLCAHTHTHTHTQYVTVLIILMFLTFVATIYSFLRRLDAVSTLSVGVASG